MRQASAASSGQRLAVLLVVGSAVLAVCSAVENSPSPAATPSPSSNTLDPVVLSMLERSLLSKMGMKERPRPKRFFVPQPLVDMYERLQRVDDDAFPVVDHDSAVGFWPEPFVLGVCLF